MKQALSTPPDWAFPDRMPTSPVRPARTATLADSIKLYQNFAAIYPVIGTPTKTYSYTVPYTRSYGWVFRYEGADGSKRFQFVTTTPGGMRIGPPALPYLLYQRGDLAKFETIFVCEGEKTTDAARRIGLIATTSMGGPRQAMKSDWSPLKHKHLVILRDFDPKGQQYAEDVAQLVLEAGAQSAKIVTLPGLKPGEGLCEWIENHDRQAVPWEEKFNAALQAEIEAIIVDTPFEERIGPLEFVEGDEEHGKDESPASISDDLQPLTEVAAELLEWVWEGVIPQGKLTLIVGEAAVGKSFLVTDIVAKITGAKLKSGGRMKDETNPHGEDDESGRQIPCAVTSLPNSAAESAEESSEESLEENAGGRPAEIACDAWAARHLDNSCYLSGRVLLLSAAEDLADTIRPRLEVAGADLSRVYAINRSQDRTGNDSTVSENDDAFGTRFDDLGEYNEQCDGSSGGKLNWERDLSIAEAKLERSIAENDPVRLIVIDPVSRYFAQSDSKKVAEVGAMASRLAALAAKYRVGILLIGIADTGKSANGKRQAWSDETRALASASRSVWMIARDVDHPPRRIFLPIKMNLREEPPGLAYSIENGRLEWEPELLSMTSDELISETAEQSRRLMNAGHSSELSRAMEWLTQRLAGRVVFAGTLFPDAKAFDLTEITVRRALKKLECRKKIAKDSRRWCWHLPGQTLEGIEIE